MGGGGFGEEVREGVGGGKRKDGGLSVGVAVVGGGRAALPEIMRVQLQEAAEADLGDFLQFRIGAALMELAGAPLGGARYLCEALVAGKIYARFHVDVGVGDVVTGEPERLQGEDILAFAGITPPNVLSISR